MTWVTYWFVVFLIELGLWGYIAYLHWEIKELRHKTDVKYPKEKTLIVRSKKDIVRG
jgi:hypothetical protein